MKKISENKLLILCFLYIVCAVLFLYCSKIQGNILLVVYIPLAQMFVSLFCVQYFFPKYNFRNMWKNVQGSHCWTTISGVRSLFMCILKLSKKKDFFELGCGDTWLSMTAPAQTSTPSGESAKLTSEDLYDTVSSTLVGKLWTGDKEFRIFVRTNPSTCRRTLFHPITHKNAVPEDRFHLIVTSSITLRCRTFCLECSGDSQNRLHWIGFKP